jgi:DNA-binding NtrC family response regulator
MTQRPTILVVDDYAPIASAITRILRAQGFDVAWAPDVASALRTLDGACHSHIDVKAVITDINMPGPSGLELVRVLHEERPDLPVIVITGLMSAAMRDIAISDGAFDVIGKPFSPTSIALAVELACTPPTLPTS